MAALFKSLLDSVFSNPKTTFAGLLVALAGTAVEYFTHIGGGWVYVGSAIAAIVGLLMKDPAKKPAALPPPSP